MSILDASRLSRGSSNQAELLELDYHPMDGRRRHNRPIWETIVAGWLEKLPAPVRADEPHRLSAYIVCVALG